jgi:hypothetical protein
MERYFINRIVKNIALISPAGLNLQGINGPPTVGTAWLDRYDWGLKARLSILLRHLIDGSKIIYKERNRISH